MLSFILLGVTLLSAIIKAIMLGVTYTECHNKGLYAVCHHAGLRYAECRSALPKEHILLQS
jgi:hypothetical protein